MTIRPAAVVDVGEQLVEPARLVLREPGQQLLDAHFDRHLLGRQQHLGALLRALDDRLERRQQAEQIDFELRLVVVAGDRRDALVRPLPLRRAQLLAFVQQSGGRLELLVLEQPADQRVARILFLVPSTRRPRSPAAAAASST